MVRAYYLITKPGIVFGNAITMAAGFALASKGPFPWALFFWTLLGLSCVIASACIFNNCIDRKADAKMSRTQKRPLATGAIGLFSALGLAFIGLVAGTYLLYVHSGSLALGSALVGFVLHVFVYTYLKYKTPHATLIGSFSGAIPPVVGYAAAAGRLDERALLLFALVTLWQMPHFYAIAIYRLADYRAASIPVLPVRSGLQATKVHMSLFAAAFLFCSILPTLLGYTGLVYLAAALTLGLGWLGQCLLGFRTQNDVQWAKGTFFGSLIVIMAISLMISIDKF